jgi:DNA-binding response OmpR family regulator
MKNILIVDDEAVLAETAALLLKHQGYQVQWASDGSQALKLIEDHKPDLVIADLVMPNMDGLQLLEWVRDHRSLDKVKYLLMTVKESVLEPLKRHRIGADDYMSKPFDKKQLLEKVKKLIGES